MEDILSRGAPFSGKYHSHGQDHSPDDIGPLGSLLAARFTARFGVPHVQGPPSNISTRQPVNTRQARKSRRTCPQMFQEQYDSILEHVIRDGRQEFDEQSK